MSATPFAIPKTADSDEVIDVDASPVIAEASDPALVIASVKPFAGLSEAVVDAVAETAVVRHYPAGQTVYAMGQFDGGEAFIVADGLMRVSVVDADTGSIMIEDIGPKSAFALDIAFCDVKSNVFSRLSITAEEDLVLVCVDAESLRTLAAQRPSLMRNIAHYFAQDLGERRFNATSAQAAPQQRVFSQLLKYVERDDITGDWRVPQMPKHRELADLANVDEGIAAGAVATLIQDGIAQRDYPGLVVKDMARLHELTR